MIFSRKELSEWLFKSLCRWLLSGFAFRGMKNKKLKKTDTGMSRRPANCTFMRASSANSCKVSTIKRKGVKMLCLKMKTSAKSRFIAMKLTRP